MNEAMQEIRNGSFLNRLNMDTLNEMKFTQEMEEKFLMRHMSLSSKKIREKIKKV